MHTVLFAALIAAQPTPSSMTTSYDTQTLAPGVTAFVAPNGLGAWVTGNALLVVGDSAALLVDPGHFPPLARRMIADIRRITPVPVRWVVNTHWHPDHWMANAEYARAFPGVSIVSAPATRDSIRSRGATFVRGHQDSAAVYGGYETMLAKGVSPFRPNRPLSTGERHGLELAVADGRAAFAGWRDVEVVVPNVVFADRRTIPLGGRDVEVRFLGRGNTAGDVVVWVPGSRILAAGDLVVAPIPYAYGSYVAEWVETLARLKALGATTLVPGHGAVQRDAAYVDRLAGALAALRDRAADARRRGLTLDSARAALRFDDLERAFEGDDPRLRGLMYVHFVGPGFPRAFDEAQRAP